VVGDPAVSAQRGESGLSQRDEAIAEDAVRRHLRDAGVVGQLGDVRLYPLGASDEVVVCGTLPVPGDRALQIVARVVLASPGAVQVRPPMVIMEAGPGLGRGGPLDGPGLRYCRQPGPPAVAGAEPAARRAVHAAEMQADAALAPVARVVVVSPARLRAAPESQGAILGTVPRGASYAVLGRAPGGWVQISDGEAALGWVHASLLDTSP
jgi:hypothetical protein